MSEIVSLNPSPVLTDDMLLWVKALHQQAIETSHRRALVLSGNENWLEDTARTVLHGLCCESVLWVSSRKEGALPPEKARTQLGHEYDVIVFDAFEKMDVDALGAISGTLRGGGILLLLIPLRQDWQMLKTSRFHQRAWPLLQSHAGVVFLQQEHALPELLPVEPRTQHTANVEKPFCTLEQQQVVNVIESTVLNKQSQAMVLISDRGRGKSSALGLAAGCLLQQGIKNIIVTAPRLTTSDPVFQHAQNVCLDSRVSRGQLSTEQGSLKFMAPDALLIEKPSADLLLVDEASAIPLQLLESFLQNYPSIVFATTVHGYEGTGRGFTLKFSKVLDAHAPGWKTYKMETPIRWASNDPLEAWVDKLLCLDTELQNVPDIRSIKRDQCRVQLVDRDQLLNSETQLSSLFALLVNAHYRTQPSDFQHLLDDPDVRVYTLEYQQYLLGAILINEEGGFDKTLSEKIYRGERRPAGNLLAQTLSFHAGCESAATLIYARVMRIAVHPELQGKGLGSQLLQSVISQEQQRGVAAIGTSFGATVELLRFWQSAGLDLVRMGFTRDHASGTHSAIMLKPLNDQGVAVYGEVRSRFQHYLSAWLAGPLHDVPDEMKRYLKQEQQVDGKELSNDDWKEIKSFAQTHRSYEATMWPIIKLLKLHKAKLDKLKDKDRRVLQARVIDNKNWMDTVKYIHATGKAEALQCLRQAVNSLMTEIKKDQV